MAVISGFSGEKVQTTVWVRRSEAFLRKHDIESNITCHNFSDLWSFFGFTVLFSQNANFSWLVLLSKRIKHKSTQAIMKDPLKVFWCNVAVFRLTFWRTSHSLGKNWVSETVVFFNNCTCRSTCALSMKMTSLTLFASVGRTQTCIWCFHVWTTFCSGTIVIYRFECWRCTLIAKLLVWRAISAETIGGCLFQ